MLDRSAARALTDPGPSAREPLAPAGEDPTAEAWRRVDLQVERLDWLPRALAALDRPFVIERPDELRALVVELAERLVSRARNLDLLREPADGERGY